jgi:bacterioferritin-associated ferredoxin
MYVCVCNAVTDREIVERVRRGARSLESIRIELGVASGCGQCVECASALIDRTLSAIDDPSTGADTGAPPTRDLIPSTP